MAKFEKVDDYTVALTTSIIDLLLPYEIAVYYQISNCAVTKLNNDYSAYAKAPVVLARTSSTSWCRMNGWRW